MSLEVREGFWCILHQFQEHFTFKNWVSKGIKGGKPKNTLIGS